MNLTSLNAEEKLLYNGLFFCELRLQSKINDKLTNLEKYLTKGVDVNTPDANDSNNTPLHIAVKKDEPEIIEFLLQKGANPKAKNKNMLTPIDLAKLTNKQNMNDVIKIIEASIISIQDYDSNLSKLSKKVLQGAKDEVARVPKDKNIKLIEENALINESRSGTAGISGQLYETKLLGLLLHRALNDEDIEEFYIGTNITGIGAFDDIAFKYYLKNDNNPRMFFVQAKHKDTPTKDKLTIDRLLNSNYSDFNIYQYFESFMKIRHKMKQKCINVMFKNDLSISDCRFIIYTPAVEQFHKKRLIEVCDKESLLSSSDKGKIFMYDYDDDDVELLVKNTLLLEAKALAKAFATHIVKDKYEKMMWDELIQVYHVFLAQNVVETSNVKLEGYVIGRFRKSFLESKDNIFLHMKNTMLKETKIDVTLEFKLPKYFGNIEVPLSEDQYIELWKVIQNLMSNGKMFKNDDDLITIVIEDIMVDEVITKNDLTNIKYLVGETLIYDNETGLFKFNLKESIPEKNKKLFEKLKLNVCNNSDLKNVRFEINIHNFPQLSLSSGSNQKRNIIYFLNKLQFHTNQAQEEDVEKVLKKEIGTLYNNENNKTNAFYHIKSNAIFLEYHDRIQKWWKNPQQYLTKFCQFYKNSKDSILNSPILNILNYIYTSKIDRCVVNFTQNSIENLGLEAFMNRPDDFILNIITQNKLLTCLKIKKYFTTRLHNNYYFIDTNDILTEEVNSEVILSEISKENVIIIITSDMNPITDLEMTFIGRLNNNKVIIIHSKSLLQINNLRCSEQIDNHNSLCHFDEETKLMIVNQNNIIFQGSKVPFMALVDESIYQLVKENLLDLVLKNSDIKIGKEPIDFKAYNKTKKFYVNRRICRCYKQTGEQYFDSFDVIHDNSVADAESNKDILIVSNDDNTFNLNCKRYSNKNIHWFQKQNEDTLWVKSYGSIEKLIPWIERNKCGETEICSLQPQSLAHMNDRVVIIIAGPGMGKSTLLTHLMIQTKVINNRMCVLKLNLLDLKNKFSTWQECNYEMRFSWFLTVLYEAFSIYETDCTNTGIFFNNLSFIDDTFQTKVTIKEVKKIKNMNDLKLFEVHVFLKLYNDNKIALVFDGFDEICPNYKKEAIELFKFALNSQIKHIWITSRHMSSNELEFEMNTFSYTLKGFTKNEQILFLEDVWMVDHLVTNHFKKKNLRLYVTQFLDAISHKIMDHTNSFTCTPLHLRMISEAFQQTFINYYFNSTENSRDDIYDAFNLITIYDKFINIKFHKIRFVEKKDGLLHKDPDMITIIERERILFIENHKKLATYFLLHKNRIPQDTNLRSSNNQYSEGVYEDNTADEGILTKDDLKHIDVLLNTFSSGNEKTGIIETVIQNEPRFVHLTFAEYFASELVCDKLKQTPISKATWKYLVNHILVIDNEGIRRFIDARLEKDQVLSNLTSKFICDALLSQSHSSKSALYVAVIEGRYNISLFLLNSLSVYLNKNSLDDFITLILKKYKLCTLCSTFNFCSHKVVTRIIEIIEQLDGNKLKKLVFCEDYPNMNIFKLTILNQDTNFNVDNLNKILMYTNSEDLIKVLLNPIDSLSCPSIFYNRPVLHIISEMSQKQHFLKYLKNLNQSQCMRVFCATDQKRRVPAHGAAEHDNFEFFEVMASLVTNKQFKQICTFKDINGIIPLRCFGSIPFTLSRFKPICVKAGIDIGFRGEGRGWFLYDIENPDCIW